MTKIRDMVTSAASKIRNLANVTGNIFKDCAMI